MSPHTPLETVEVITHSDELVEAAEDLGSSRHKTVRKYSLAIMIVTLSVLSVFLFLSAELLVVLQKALHKDNHLFFWMLFVGFAAEIVAGSMGMGYGVICTTILLILNVPPPVVSASIHSAESFTSAAGTLSHWQLGNINKKLTK